MSESPSRKDGERGPKSPRRREAWRRGLTRALAEPMQRVTRSALGTRSLGEATLLSQWPAIAGETLALACWPRRIVFPRRGERREGTLVLKVKPAQATRVAHLEPVLVERVNGFFGYKAVARLRLEHGELPRRADDSPVRERRTLSESESAAVRDSVAPVGDDELRDALERLGRTLRAHEKP